MCFALLSPALAWAGPCEGVEESHLGKLGCSYYHALVWLPSLALPELSVVIDPATGDAPAGFQWDFPVVVHASDWGHAYGYVSLYNSVTWYPKDDRVFGRVGVRVLLDFEAWAMPYFDAGGVIGDTGSGPRVGAGVVYGRGGVGLYLGLAYEPLFLGEHRTDQLELVVGIAAPLMF